MIFLEVYHHKTFIINASKKDIEYISNSLTVFKEKFKMSKNAESEWEVTYLLSFKDYSFSTAYLETVLEYCDKEEITYQITDKRKYPSFTLPKLSLRVDLTLRDDQKRAVQATEDNKTGIVMMPTASGKSRVISSVIDKKKVRTLVVVPKTNLQFSMKDDFSKQFGPSRVDTQIPFELREKMKRGIFDYEEDGEDGDFEIKDNPLKKKIFVLDDDIMKPIEKTKKTSAFDEIFKEAPKKIKFTLDEDLLVGDSSETPESAFLKDKRQKGYDKKKEYLKKKYEEQKTKKKEYKIKYKDIYVICEASLENLPQEFLDQIQMIIIDETHHAAAKRVRNTLLRMKTAAYRYYFSATPWRDHEAEEKLLASAIGTKIIYELTPQEAIEIKAIAKPELRVIESPEPSQRAPRNDWRSLVEFLIIGNEKRNKKIVDDAIKEYDQDKNVFIAVDEIAHIDILVEHFKRLGIVVDVVHGKRKIQDNLDSIKNIGSRTKGIAIGTMSVGEGTDMPNIDVVSLASGGKGSIRFLQRIGRGARKGIKRDKELFLVLDYKDWFHPTLMRHFLKRQNIFKEYYESF